MLRYYNVIGRQEEAMDIQSEWVTVANILMPLFFVIGLSALTYSYCESGKYWGDRTMNLK